MARHQRQRLAEMDITLTQHEVYSLLSKLCVELGFCLPPTKQDELAVNPPRSIREFVKAVFEAEGLEFQSADGRLRNQVWDLVSKGFGASDAQS